MMLMDMFSFNHPNGDPQTPKLESSFYDPRVTWDTSDPYASSPEFLRTPHRFALNTPSNPLRLPDDASDGLHLKTTAKYLPEDTDTAKRIRASHKPNGSLAEEGPRTVGSAKSAASMQTPPPSSASRRKVTGLEDLNNYHTTTGRNSDNNAAGGSHLETPSRLMGSSPRMLANLNSSPDLFQLGTIDPSASPFLPQQKLFWDDHLDQPASDLALSGSSSNVDLFGSNGMDTINQNHATGNDAVHDPTIPQLPTIEGTVDLPGFNNNGFVTTTAAPTDAAFFPAPFSTSPRLPPTRAEDPAMFLSSPARRFGGPQPTPDRRQFQRTSRQPYHYQTEESKREQLRRAHSVHRQHPAYDDDEDDDDYTPRRLRPGLTRSVTHTAVSSSANRPTLGQPTGMMASTSGIRKSPSKGRSSPVKPLRNPLPRANSVATGLPTRSQSVVLKIGKDGRAKAEMQTVPEVPTTGLTDPIAGMDLEGSTTESEYDGAEHSEYQTMPSRHPSFALSDAGRPTLTRSDSGSRPHSKGSYTSTVASGHSGRASPWPGSSRGGSRRPQFPQYRPSSSSDDWRRTPTKRQPPVLNSDFTHGSASSVPGAFDDPEEDSGDAQHALRKVLRERGRGPRPHTVGYGARPNPSSRSLAHLRSSPPPRFGAELDLNTRDFNSSPTTMTDPDLATPITNRYSNPSNGTRCVCNSMDNGGHLMIQCESCNHWLHTKCVGLERANLPSVYVCMFCAHTPTRQNRVRGPLGGGGHAPTSPLAHKSFRFR